MDKSLTDLIQPSKDDIIENQKKEINELKKDKEKLQTEEQKEQQYQLMKYHTP